MIRILVIAVFMGIAPLSRAQDATSVQTFDEGTAALIDGRFHDALRAFESIETSGWESSGLYYNMALVHYRLDHLGQAIRYLEKARALNEDDPRILHSLAIAGQRQADRFSTLPDPFWLRARAGLVEWIPVGTAFFLGLVCWFGFVGAWLAGTVADMDGTWWRRGRNAALTIGLVLIVHALAASIWPPHPDRSVVLTERLVLREQANSDAPEVIEVHEGLVLKVHAKTADWRLVEIPNGTRGWVLRSALGDI